MYKTIAGLGFPEDSCFLGKSAKSLIWQFILKIGIMKFHSNYANHMNTVQTIHTEYLRASRTLETIVVSNKRASKVFFMYNYEGNSFRLFENQLDVIRFFQDQTESEHHFNTEIELDRFLEEFKIVD